MENKQSQFYTVYRMSDRGNQKEKLPNVTKKYCLENYLAVFGSKNVIVFADNCNDSTLAMVKEKGIEPITTTLGNKGSFLKALDFATEKLEAEADVYFLEDDYLHLPGAREILLEGLTIGDYVTLYDHPDKYLNHCEGGPNTGVVEGGEVSRVFLTKNTHWKNTNSTVMTFAVSVKTLREDKSFFEKYQMNSFVLFGQLTGVPRIFKHKVWKNLSFRQPRCYRRVISCIPGRSTHAERAWLSPLVDWEKV